MSSEEGTFGEEILRLRKENAVLRGHVGDLTELAVWMSGSDDFSSPHGIASVGWVKMKPALEKALAWMKENP